jgi:hypothetical protein
MTSAAVDAPTERHACSNGPSPEQERNVAVFNAGPDQVIVVYETAERDELRRKGLTTEFLQSIADDAARRAAEGFAIVAYDSLETAGYGTSGGIVLNTGDEHPLDIAVTVVYARRPAG